jgi:hypothetical protein
MFAGCSNLTTIPVYNVSKGQDFDGTFQGCGLITFPN